MARRRAARRDSMLARYAQHGPTPMDMVPYSDTPRLVWQMLHEWKAWRDEYLGRWLAGDVVPAPPHADKCVSARGEV
ncbi:MAG: hypothetical protein ACJ738_02125 [Gaiellales bacterium]